MATMMSLYAEKCCHLVSEHNKASTRRLCSNIRQFPISSALLLVLTN